MYFIKITRFNKEKVHGSHAQLRMECGIKQRMRIQIVGGANLVENRTKTLNLITFSYFARVC